MKVRMNRVLFAVIVAVLLNEATTSSVVYQQFRVDSEIVSRYSTTTITSVVFNNANVSQELSFQVQLPETAFISNFTMIVDGRTFHGIAQEKEKAARDFEVHQNQGENVGLVESRGTDIFTIRTNTASNSTATFELKYEELIIRRKSKFQQTLNLNPGSVVNDFQVTVRAVDDQGIVDTGASDYVSVGRVSGEEVVFSYSPSLEEQDDTENGLARDMVVEFDVNHPSDGAGLIVVNDCYFAQFFSPSGIEALPVDLVFVIDVSGSMSGQKIDQTREALETITNDLRPQDRFTMVTFASTVGYWMNSLVSVSEYRQQAIQFARGLIANGGTNFNKGLLAGANILKTDGNSNYVPLLVIMTDGQPTVGIIDADRIISNAGSALAGTTISLNCLGFGNDLNYDLLEQLSLANKGTPRRIYIGEDAASQLEGFFDEISSPILREITVTYQNSSTEIISDTQFPLLFNGSEIVIAGKFQCSLNDSDIITVKIVGEGATQEITFTSEVNTKKDTSIAGKEPSTERLVAYLHIKQLLDQLHISESESEIAEIEKKVLEVALQYNFVTDLTSLLVVEEGSEENTTNEEPTLVSTSATFPPDTLPNSPPPNPNPPSNPCSRGTCGGNRLADSYALPPPTQQPSTQQPSTQPSIPSATPSRSTPQPTGGTPLVVRFINNSPRIVGNDTIEADFAVQGPTGSRVSCHLTGLSPKDCSSGHVSFTNLAPGKYLLRVVVTHATSRVKVRSRLQVGHDSSFCYVHWINSGVTVKGTSAKAEFVGEGAFTTLLCRLNSGSPYPCMSPLLLTGLSPGKHRLRIVPTGCATNERITDFFNI